MLKRVIQQQHRNCTPRTLLNTEEIIIQEDTKQVHEGLVSYSIMKLNSQGSIFRGLFDAFHIKMNKSLKTITVDKQAERFYIILRPSHKPVH